MTPACDNRPLGGQPWSECLTCDAKEGEPCKRRDGLARAGMNRLATDNMHGRRLPVQK